ncbi:MAG: hypothetical protein M3349_09925 [Actinomycetota bacterium]|nr:hypothetical protein [Actinomycetota bacterium]
MTLNRYGHLYPDDLDDLDDLYTTTSEIELDGGEISETKCGAGRRSRSQGTLAAASVPRNSGRRGVDDLQRVAASVTTEGWRESDQRRRRRHMITLEGGEVPHYGDLEVGDAVSPVRCHRDPAGFSGSRSPPRGGPVASAG